MKKVYAFHSVEFHKTLGGLQGETLIDTSPLGQVKKSTENATKAAATSPDSVNPIVSTTISQLERKVEKTYVF